MMALDYKWETSLILVTFLILTLVSEKYAEVRCFAIDSQILTVISMSEFNNLKLLRVVLIQERDGYTHHPVVVFRDGLGEPDFNGVVVVVLGVTFFPNFLAPGVFQVVRHRQEFQGFVATTVFDVGEPPGRYLRTLMTVVLHDIFDFDVVRDGEQQGVTPTRPALRVRAHPHLIV